MSDILIKIIIGLAGVMILGFAFVFFLIRSKSRGSTVIGVGGLNGEGKTDLGTKIAVRLMNRMLKRYPDFRFASNIAIMNVPWQNRIIRYNKLVEISYLTNAVVFIDEVQDQVPNRDWANNSTNIIKFFEQHRHSNLRIVMTSQVFRKLDIKIRELINQAFEVQKIAGVEKKYCIYKIVQLDHRRIASAPNMEAIPLAPMQIPRLGWTAWFRKSLYNTWEDNALVPYRLCLKIKDHHKTKIEIRSMLE